MTARAAADLSSQQYPQGNTTSAIIDVDVGTIGDKEYVVIFWVCQCFA